MTITAVHLDAARAIHVVDLPHWSPTALHGLIGGTVLSGRRLPRRVLGVLSGRRASVFHAVPRAGSMLADERIPLTEYLPAVVVASVDACVVSMTATDLASVAAYLVTAEGFRNPETIPARPHLWRVK